MQGNADQTAAKLVEIFGVPLVITVKRMKLSCRKRFVQISFLLELLLKRFKPWYLSIDSSRLSKLLFLRLLSGWSISRTHMFRVPWILKVGGLFAQPDELHDH